MKHLEARKRHQKGHQGHQVKITKTTKNGREVWRLNVPATFGGRRQRKFFATRAAAEIWISEARKNLREHGRIEPAEQGMSVEEALVAYLEAKDGVGERHRRAIEHYCEQLKRTFGKRQLSSVSVLELNKWINRPEWSQASRATARRYALGFWNWCLRNELIERNRLLGTEAHGGRKKQIEILTVRQCRELLEASQGRMRAFFVLQLFAGLRTCEAMAAHKSWINLKDKELIVYDSKETTGIPRRTVKLRPAFLRWWPKGITGKIWDKNARNWRRDRAALFAALKWHPKQNASRHTFASYLLAKERSAAAVALELGHASEQMVQRVYGHAVPAREAEKFWDL